MQLKVILNRVHKLRSFVYGRIWQGKDSTIQIEVRPRVGSRPCCPGCHKRCPTYDTLRQRRFSFVPLWGLPVVLLYARRRVDCKRCGVLAEWLPWAEGKSRLCEAYAWFLARWAKRLSWAEVARCFQIHWSTVRRAVELAVDWGLEHRDLSNISAIGVDEVQWKAGHKYLTVVYQIDAHCRRLLWIGEHRKAKTLLRFFRWLGPERTAKLQFICSDMWQAYRKVIFKKAHHALHILDRYHIVARIHKAIDKIRAQEARKLREQGKQPVLKNSRWCLLKRPENLTEAQDVKLAELLSCNLRTVRAYLLKEDFRFFWEYQSPFWARCFLDRWCTKVMRSKLGPLKKVAQSLRKHRELLLNYFRARKAFSAGIVEGFNNKLKLTTRTAYGYRSLHLAQVALYHALGNLPEPTSIHRF